MFSKPEKLNILICPKCHGTGHNQWRNCSDCQAMPMGHYLRSKWLYWQYPLTRDFLALEKGRRILEKIRAITAFTFGLGMTALFIFLAYKEGALKYISSFSSSPLSIFLSFSPLTLAIFWLAVINFTYLWYRSVRQREFLGEVEHYEYNFVANNQQGADYTVDSWAMVKKISRKNKKNIAKSYTTEANMAIGDSYRLADSTNHSILLPIHLFATLLNFNRISNIFIRLGISAQTIQNKLIPLFNSEKIKSVAKHISPQISDDFIQTLFLAYESAYNAHLEYVSVTELLIVAVAESEDIQGILFDLGIDKAKLANVVEWARIRERLYHRYVKFRKAASRRSKYGMDKAMTAVATPYLNRFSDDLTVMAQYGHLQVCIAREKEVEDIFRIVEGGRQNILLVGDHGIGKRTIIDGLAQRMVEDDVPARLKDKRLVRLNISSLLAGTTPAGSVERLQRMMSEISRAGNIILYIHNLHELIGVTAGSGKGSLDVADTLSEYLNGGHILTIADTTPEFYAQLIVNSSIGNVFAKVEISEMDVNQSIQVLESRAGGLEYKHHIFFAYSSIEKAVELSKRFLHETYLPGNALEIMTESASYTRNKRGSNSIVTAEDAAVIIANKTKIPVTTISSDESDKLIRLEQEMHKRVIGQHEAVESIANALRRARVEIRSQNRPIANFLFLGPTGVGKTELAKTIAEIYFGGENRMVRLDMSEYQDKSGIYRLIGSPGQKGSGILTEAVRQNPFCLVLLDELEKAEPDILNLFLQVMDDGRLTDSTGRVVDFTSVILIATSNAGTAYVQDQIRAGTSFEVIKEKLMHGELRQYFRPEFLNRFDGIILFRALERAEIKKISQLMLNRIGKELETKGILFKVEESALEFLADVGFDPEFGARPMRRAIQDRVENKLAELLLAGKLRRKDTIVIGNGGEVRVE